MKHKASVKQVWLVERGEYDQAHIVRAFLSEEEAKTFAEAGDLVFPVPLGVESRPSEVVS